MFFSSDFELIEPAVAYLHEHAIQRAHTRDTLNTYTELLYDWFEALERRNTAWRSADAVDLVAYRNRMMTEPSGHTGKPYSVRTINHRVRGVLRFYEWMVRNGWLAHSDLIARDNDFAVARTSWTEVKATERSMFLLRQFETLPRPLCSGQLRELLAELPSPYDLMSRWQLYTGLRVSELLRLTVDDIRMCERSAVSACAASYRVIEVTRKGLKCGYVLAPETLLEETAGYLAQQRRAWLKRRSRRGDVADYRELFINSRGVPVKKNSYQQVIADAGETCGFRATTHLMRATFACMMLARLERLAQGGAQLNPLLIVKILMGHEHVDTTDRYLRAIAVDEVVLVEVLDSLLDRD